MPASYEQGTLSGMSAAASRSSESLGVIYALISAASFGFLGVLGALGRVHGFTNSTLLSWRFIGSAVILGGMYWGRNGIPRFETRPFLLGIAGYSLQSLIFFETVERIGPGKAAILLYTYPALVTLLGWLSHRQRPARAHLAGLAVTTVGCLLVLYSHEGAFSLIGVILGLTTALVYSVYLILGEQVLKGIGAMTSSFNVCLGTGISMVILSLMEPRSIFPTTAAQWGIIAGLVLLCTVLPTLTLFSAIRRIGSVKASLCSTIEPVVAAVLGVLIFAEDFAPQQILGGAMVVSSIAIIYLASSQGSRHPA